MMAIGRVALLAVLLAGIPALCAAQTKGQEPQAAVLRTAFVYTELDLNNHIDCKIRPSSFVASVQHQLIREGVQIVGPNAGEDVAFYVVINTLRSPTPALMGECIASVGLTVFRPISLRLPGSPKERTAKGVLCSKSAVIAPSSPKGPEPEALEIARQFASECIAKIRETETTGAFPKPIPALKRRL